MHLTTSLEQEDHYNIEDNISLLNLLYPKSLREEIRNSQWFTQCIKDKITFYKLHKEVLLVLEAEKIISEFSLSQEGRTISLFGFKGNIRRFTIDKWNPRGSTLPSSQIENLRTMYERMGKIKEDVGSLLSHHRSEESEYFLQISKSSHT